jgi:hypothetical protein
MADPDCGSQANTASKNVTAAGNGLEPPVEGCVSACLPEPGKLAWQIDQASTGIFPMRRRGFGKVWR